MTRARTAAKTPGKDEGEGWWAMEAMEVIVRLAADIRYVALRGWFCAVGREFWSGAAL